jgi:hypothetical protein
MGEAREQFFRPTFNRAIQVSARDEQITSKAGTILLRELDHRLGLLEGVVARMSDPRNQDLIRYTLLELLRERCYGMALGETTGDDSDLLCQDPALRAAVWDRPGDQVLQERLASQPTQSRLVDMLANFPENVQALRDGLWQCVQRHLRAAGDDRRVRRGTIDIDSFPVPVYGSQPGGAYNGHYDQKIYHPLLTSFSARGDYDDLRLGDGFVNAQLRAGNVASAKGSLDFILQAVERCSRFAMSVDLRMDAAFMNGEILDPLADLGLRVVGRLITNVRLQKLAEAHLTRPVGRPPSVISRGKVSHPQSG